MLKRIGTEESGEFRAIASGTLPSGKPVIINADGTVSVVSETSYTQSVGAAVARDDGADTTLGSYYSAGFDSSNNKVIFVYRDNTGSGEGRAIVGTVSGNSISFGTPAAFSSNNIAETSITFDSSNGKVFIAYTDTNNSSYGTGVVGTVSGTSISFGTPVSFNNGTTTKLTTVFDSSNNKVVVAYRDDSQSDHGKAVVGTISGTSVSFGSEVTFNAANTVDIKAAFDSNENKVVIAYRDSGNSSYGTAIVGTVSGTSISFGSEVVFESADSRGLDIAYDSNSQKILIGFELQSSGTGYAIVGTVSGTSISFGSKSQFTTNQVAVIRLTYDSAAQKVLILYRNQSTSPYSGRIFPATISGTSVSFGTETTWSSTSFAEPAMTYDSNQQKAAFVYQDANNSHYFTARVFQTGYTSQNLTSENYIGISKGGPVADTKGATVDIIGAIADVPQVFYDIANASYESKSFAAGGGSYGAFIRSDGLKLYTSSFGTNGNIYEYTLSSANDVSSASLANTKATNSDLSSIAAGVFFKTDGTAMFVSDYQNGRVGQYTLSSAWDVSSASFSSSDTLDTSSQNAYPRTVFFKPDGLTLFLLGDDEVVYQYTLSSAWDLSSASYASKSFSVTSQEDTGYGIWFNNTGTKMYYTGGGNVLYQYSLGTAYDIATASYDSVSFDHSATGGTAYGIIFSDDGSKMIRVSSSSATLFQYNTQFSLTAGQSFYVQSDGTLSTTADDPSVLAGTAISATELLVKT